MERNPSVPSLTYRLETAATSGMDTPDMFLYPSILVWPEDAVPTEIFDQIIQHLQFSDVRNMRLVCREFREKTSANFAHTFAARFKPEFCPLTPGPSSPLPGYDRSIFSQYGYHTRRFSLCLEVDENELSCPSIKPDHKLVPSFWGFYLWPNDGLRCYPDLERLETAANNTKGMTETLRPLVNVTDIAISCDPGWGRLLGPERQHVAARVFRGRYEAMGFPTVRDRLPSRHTPLPGAPNPIAEDAVKRRKSMLRKMILSAGIDEEDLDSVLQSVDVMASLVGQVSTLSLKESQPGLNPIKLSIAQKEFLMELELASRAFVQSWAVAIMDLSGSDGFCYLVCLRLAKIPSSHLPILTANRFWDSLHSLREVHLQVLADWRRLSRKQGTGIVTDKPVEPVEAGTNAFQLLHLISKKRNITTLHFEWLCGGELSWGSQRGRYILPAPFTSRPDLIVRQDIVSQAKDVIFLPHVTKLSLKNCWCSPHIFLHVVKCMAESSLVELKLESVSLSGPAVPSPNLAQGPRPLRRLLERYVMLRPLLNTPPVPVVYVPGVPANLAVPAPMMSGPTVGPVQAVPTSVPNPSGPPGTVPSNLPGATVPEPVPSQGVPVLNSNTNTLPGLIAPHPPGPTVPVLTDLAPVHLWGVLAPEPSPDTPPGPVPTNQPPPSALSRFSWPGIIDALSSGPKIPTAATPDEDKPKTPIRPALTIERMEFKSCGYVAVESSRIDTSRLGTWRSFANYYRWTTCELELPNRRRPFFGLPIRLENEAMQSSWSELNGWVSPYLPRHEAAVLRDVFGMRMGWRGVYDAQTVTLAKAVNPNEPGQGRFSGVVTGEEL